MAHVRQHVYAQHFSVALPAFMSAFLSDSFFLFQSIYSLQLWCLVHVLFEHYSVIAKVHVNSSVCSCCCDVF